MLRGVMNIVDTGYFGTFVLFWSCTALPHDSVSSFTCYR